MRKKTVLRYFLLLFLIIVGIPTTLLFRIYYLPIPISNIETLQKIGSSWRYPLSGHYVLTQNIDASETATWNEGTGFMPIGIPADYQDIDSYSWDEYFIEFSGTLDGRGYTIQNLYMNHIELEVVALFAMLSSTATIMNLGIVEHDIFAKETAAVLALVNAGTVRNTYATGIVQSPDALAVGLIALNDVTGVIDSCYTANHVVSKGSDNTYARGAVGLAFNNYGIIERSYTAGLVSGVESVGFVKSNSGIIRNCFSIATVIENHMASGFVESNYSPAVIENSYTAGAIVGMAATFESYNSSSTRFREDDMPVKLETTFWNADIYTTEFDHPGTGLTTGEMLHPEPFQIAGWDLGTDDDFSGTWTQQRGITYPVLSNSAMSAPAEYTLTIEAERGTVSLSSEGDSHPAWSLVHLTATPEPGYAFLGWHYKNYEQIDPWKINPLPVVMHDHISLKAVFAPIIAIDSIEALQKIGNDPDFPLFGHYELTQDIDASVTVSWNDGAGFLPIGNFENPFMGVLDGRGHVIQDLYINQPDNNGVAIIANLGASGHIKNLELKSGLVKGNHSVAALVAWNNGIIENCGASMTIQSNGNAAGLVAYNWREITRCSSTGLVFGSYERVGGLVASNYGDINLSYSTAFVSGMNKVGGLVGHHHGHISDSFSAGVISGNNIVGGLTGIAISSQVKNSYSIGMVDGNDGVGGLLGFDIEKIPEMDDPMSILYLDRSSTVTQSFWCVEESGQSESTEGTGIYRENILNSSTFQEAGWQFTEENSQPPVWKQVDGVTIPHFYHLETSDREIQVEVEAVNGQIRIEPELTEYVPWSLATLYPEPDPGYAFAGWVRSDHPEHLLPPIAPLELVLHDDITYQAIFLPDTTIEIDSIETLQRIGTTHAFPLHWEYDLSQDIDASDTATWNDGAGFVPLAQYGRLFNGVLNGNGHVIHHLHINRPDELKVGFINHLGPKGRVEKLGLSGGKIMGKSWVGSIACYNAGLIDQCFVDNEVISNFDYDSSSSRIAGIISMNLGILQNSYFKGTIKYDRHYALLVFDNKGTIQYCYAWGYDPEAWGELRAVVSGDYPKEKFYASFWPRTEPQFPPGSLISGLGAGPPMPGIGIPPPHIPQIESDTEEEDEGNGESASEETTDSEDDTQEKQQPMSMPMNVMGMGLGMMGGGPGGPPSPMPEPLPTDSRPLSEEEMKTRSVFEEAEWDFDTIWGIEDGVSYPYLLWERAAKSMEHQHK